MCDTHLVLQPFTCNVYSVDTAAAMVCFVQFKPETQ